MKNYKAVLKSSLVMLVLFAVAGSGVAQAQSCQARAKSTEMVRAEGITEMVGEIELQCRRPGGDTDSFFDATIPAMLDITVQLNTNITNEVSDARVVKLETEAPGYQDGGIFLDANVPSPATSLSSAERNRRKTSGTVNFRTTATLSSGRKSILPRSI